MDTDMDAWDSHLKTNKGTERKGKERKEGENVLLVHHTWSIM
jgi:hypothetical protein